MSGLWGRERGVIQQPVKERLINGRQTQIHPQSSLSAARPLRSQIINHIAADGGG